MSDNVTEEKDHAYFIQLPIARAVELSDELEEAVWEIARKKGVEKTLRDANFDLRVGKTFIDPHAVVSVIVHLSGSAAHAAEIGAATKAGSIAVDEAWKAWTTQILPMLKERFGPTVLVDKDKQKGKK